MSIQDIIQSIYDDTNKIILLLPIGPPGSGKTTLKNLLHTHITNRIVISPTRDEIFQTYRLQHGLKKSRHLTHQNILGQISQLEIDYPNQNILVYIDTTNSNPHIRQHYIDVVKPNITKYICFHTNHLDDPISYLQNRTKDRYHPTFPKLKEEQIKTITTILHTIQYPNNDNDNDNNDSFNIYI